METLIIREVDLDEGDMEDEFLSSCSDDNYPFMHSVSSVAVSPNTSEDATTEDGQIPSSHSTINIFSTPARFAYSRINPDESGLTVSFFSPMTSKISDSSAIHSPVPRPFPTFVSKSSTLTKSDDTTNKDKSVNFKEAAYNFVLKIVALPQTSDTWSMFIVPSIFVSVILITLIVQSLSVAKPCCSGHHVPLLSQSTVESNTTIVESAAAVVTSAIASSLNDIASAATRSEIVSAVIQTRRNFASHPVVLAFYSCKSALQEIVVTVMAFFDYWWDQFVRFVTSPPFDPIDTLGIANPL